MKKSIVLVLVLTLMGCSKSRQPIAYGTDGCAFCKMTLVDKTHASQLVTNKGKQKKYDAIECLVNDIKKTYRLEELNSIWVANYIQAGEMLQAEKAYYIISPQIQSPMGANLSAVTSRKAALDLKAKHGGEVFNWNGLLQQFDFEQVDHAHE